jgi:hypothetical protein
MVLIYITLMSSLEKTGINLKIYYLIFLGVLKMLNKL